MVLRIRLARFGNKHNPFFNIIVAQARYVVLSPNEYLDKLGQRQRPMFLGPSV